MATYAARDRRVGLGQVSGSTCACVCAWAHACVHGHMRRCMRVIWLSSLLPSHPQPLLFLCAHTSWILILDLDFDILLESLCMRVSI